MSVTYSLSLVFSSMLISFLFAMLFSPSFIDFLIKKKLGKNIRDKASGGGTAKLFQALHLKKQGTPTMGGILIWGTSLGVVLLTRVLSFYGIIEKSLLDRGQVYLPLFTLIVMGLLGAIDDYLNILESKNKGINMKPKMFFLLLFSLIGAFWFYFKLEYTSIFLPFYGNFEIGLWYFPLFVFIITGTSNAVNITDGLDGLAGGLLVMAFSSLAVLAFNKDLISLSLFCAVIVGALFAFLWNNIPPAKFYMGDTGSLALGATLGLISLMIDSVYILPLIGFIFVIETLSVIIQWTSKKLRKGKKVFHIAPIHHHFEYLKWTESQIVMRAWIIGGFFCGIGVIIGFL